MLRALVAAACVTVIAAGALYANAQYHAYAEAKATYLLNADYDRRIVDCREWGYDSTHEMLSECANLYHFIKADRDKEAAQRDIEITAAQADLKKSGL